MAVSALEQQPCVGLFGTCGNSTFRQELFIPAYESLGMPYFNPQVKDWKPELADIESDHLSHDVVQCWPVTGETYGSGSLAEQGYSIASSLRAPTPLPKFVIPMIEMELDPSLTDEVARKESTRARKLAMTHLRNNLSPNVFLVDSLNEMLDTSITLFKAASALVGLARTNNPALKRYMEERNANKALLEAMAGGALGKDAADLARKNS
jgi:hypothetical protein